MLINKSDKYTKHVEFVSYSGKYPNLCGGCLILKIDGEEVSFGLDTNDWELYISQPDYNEAFWKSGGSINNNSNSTTQDEWIIDVSLLKDKYKVYAEEINEVFNDNVPYGCCGGCR